MVKKLAIIILTLIGLTACGGGSGTPAPNNSSNTGNTATTGSTGNTSTTGGSTATPTVLEGNWIKYCGGADSSDPNTHFDEVTITFNGSNFSSDIKNYTDNLCSVALSYSPNPTSSGTFLIGNQITTSNGLTVTELDSHITQYNGAPFVIDDYTVFYIESNILYLGADDGLYDGTTPQWRNQTVDASRPYVRQ